LLNKTKTRTRTGDGKEEEENDQSNSIYAYASGFWLLLLLHQSFMSVGVSSVGRLPCRGSIDGHLLHAGAA
jgi:hypothetical protein